MSETPEGYGTQSTPDMGESYPPQTGDLLGGYIARLSARVRQCEGYNAYMTTLTERVAKLEESRKLGETPIENIDQLTAIINNWCSDLREWTGVVVRLEARVRELESSMGCIEDQMPGAAAQAATVTEDDGANLCEWCCERNGTVRPADVILCDQCNAERERQFAADYFHDTPAVTTPISELSDDGVAELRRWAKAGDAVNQPLLCATCGHGKGYHQHVMSPGTWCDSGTLGKPCHCREFKPVTTPTVTRERTHGRYGTRNLTKSKPDHIVDANKKVCATCGHAEAYHLNDTDGNPMCRAGTLGKPCKCTAFKPVATEG